MKQIKLSKGLYALVNECDYAYLNQWKWCASEESRGTKFYAVRSETRNGKRTKIRMHVEVVKFHAAQIPPGYVVDHVNHNSLDNRYFDHDAQRFQLEVITQAENMRRSPGWKRKGETYKNKSNSKGATK